MRSGATVGAGPPRAQAEPWTELRATCGERAPGCAWTCAQTVDNFWGQSRAYVLTCENCVPSVCSEENFSAVGVTPQATPSIRRIALVHRYGDAPGVDDRHRGYGSPPRSEDDTTGWVIAGGEDAWPPPAAGAGPDDWPAPSWRRSDPAGSRPTPGWPEDAGTRAGASGHPEPGWRDEPGQPGGWPAPPWEADAPGWNDPPPVD